MELKIISRAGDEVFFGDTPPPRFKKHQLTAANPIVASAGFGDVFMQHFAGKGFSIWYSIYGIDEPVTLIGKADQAVLELHIPIRNSVSFTWDGTGYEIMKEQQFDLTYTPFINTRADFLRRGEYHTFDIHYEKETLQSFAPYFPALDNFLSKVELGQPANLFGQVKFLSPDMIRVIKEMLDYEFMTEIAGAFYESKSMELLILMLKHLSGETHSPKSLITLSMDFAHDAKELISANLEYQYTASELAKIIGTNVVTLKSSFKHFYGTSMFKFGIQVRMEFAYQLLLENKYTITEIAWLVGYQEVQNFSTSFRRHFNINPSQVRSRN